MALVTAITVSVAAGVLYEAAFKEEESHLLNMAESRVRLIESVASFDSEYSQNDYPCGAFEATLSQVAEAHENFKGFGKTGEFVLAELKDNLVVFLFEQRHTSLKTGLKKGMPVPMDSTAAEPMQRALSGFSGSIVGRDYRGKEVLAAYEPVKLAGKTVGIVAKIDLSEIRTPFLMADIVAGGAAIILILAGAIVFIRVSNPLILKLKENEEISRATFEQAAVGMARVALDGRWMDVNGKLCEISGYNREELLTMTFWVFVRKQDIEEQRRCIDQLLDGEIHTFTTEKRYAHKYGKLKWVSLTISLVHGSSTENGKNFIFIIKDISEREEAEERLTRAYSDLAANNERLERFNRTMTGREMRMVGLKEEVNDLMKSSGRPIKYSVPDMVNNTLTGERSRIA